MKIKTTFNKKVSYQIDTKNLYHLDVNENEYITILNKKLEKNKLKRSLCTQICEEDWFKCKYCKKNKELSN
jgi:hypothetical protein